MKTYFTTPRLPQASRRCYFALLVISVLSLPAHGSLAQAPARTPATDSTQGYWRLKTNAATRSTHVQFFGADHHLLYEETLPEKWVKLNRKNQRQFDRLLADLQAHRYLASRLKTEALPAPPPAAPARSDGAGAASDATTKYQVNAHVDQTGKLYLAVNSPERLRYIIKLVDERGTLLYEEAANHAQYRRRMDVSALNKYRVIIFIDKKRHVYEVDRQLTQDSFRLQPLPVLPPREVPAPPADGHLLQ
ncbi:hypothetical protein HNQ92_005329 [Rhabdobacter roseus]|uniref:Uncharacterized protein n=1 Tax=Rhabdobacter roseus TaxID=1655419 RepID=A0A840U066_9BACT|nr:hypothetical protein [Rhabdobacter roseus]MBB5287167.1 hypothetical protein [Rhabdobacter roseus]